MAYPLGDLYLWVHQAMHLQKITIENVRCLPRVRLAFQPRGWHVFAGRNGSGKSTLLLAITAAFEHDAEANPHDWIRWASQYASITPFVALDTGDDRFVPFVPEPDRDPGAALEIQAAIRALDDHGGTIDYVTHIGRSSRYFSKSIGATDYGLELIDQGLNPRPAGSGWFFAAYGVSRSLVRSKVEDGARGRSFLDLGELRAAALGDAVKLLQDMDYQRLASAPGTPKHDTVMRVMDGATALLNDLLQDRGVSIIGVAPEGIRVRVDGHERSLEQMSDGVKVTTALVLDLYLRMCTAYGDRLRVEHLEIAPGQRRTVIGNSGVVLIDEVELHLHPSWQRDIGLWMVDHFPRVQFIVTTHSPFVAQAASPGCLYRMSGPGDERGVGPVDQATYARVVNGTIDDAILSDLFGVEHLYSRRGEELRQEIAALEVLAIRRTIDAAQQKLLDEKLALLPRDDLSTLDRSRRVLEKL